MKARKILLWSSATLIVLVAAAIGALSLVDAERFRPVVESQASAALGRPVSIAGDLDLQASLMPTLTATEVEVANPPGGSAEPMVRIGSLEIGLDALDLLLGKVDITRIVVADAQIDLEADRYGTGNWVLDRNAATAGALGSDVGVRVPFIERVELRDTTIGYARSDGSVFRLQVDQAAYETASFGDEIEVEIAFVTDGRQFQMDATLGSLALLNASGADWPVDLSISGGGSRISAVGTITDPIRFAGYDLNFEADMEQSAPLAGWLDQSLAALPAGSIKGNATGGRDEIRLSQVSAMLGGSDIGGDLVLAVSGERPSLTGTVSSRQLDLSALPAGDTDSSDDGESDPVVPVATLAMADIELHLTADELTVPGVAMSDVRGSVRLDDRQLKIDIEQARIFEGALVAVVTLDGRASPPTAAADFSINQFDAGALLRSLNWEGALVGFGDTSVTLAAVGATRSAMIASTGGSAAFEVGAGQLTVEHAGLLGRSILRILVPNAGSDTIAQNCAVGRFDVSEGVARSTALLIDGQQVTIAGQAAIDFGDDKIEMVLNPRAKGAEFAPLITPVRIHGDLNGPDVSVLKAEAVAETVEGLLLSVIDPFAIIVPVIDADSGTSNDNQCVAAIDDSTDAGSASADGTQAGGSTGTAEADGATDGAEDAAQDGGGVLDAVGRGIGNAFGSILGVDDPDPPAEE